MYASGRLKTYSMTTCSCGGAKTSEMSGRPILKGRTSPKTLNLSIMHRTVDGDMLNSDAIQDWPSITVE